MFCFGLCSFLFDTDLSLFSQDKDCPELRRGEVYSPLPNGGGHEAFSTPMARLPLPSQAYVMKETPYLRNLRQVGILYAIIIVFNTSLIGCDWGC